MSLKNVKKSEIRKMLCWKWLFSGTGE